MAFIQLALSAVILGIIYARMIRRLRENVETFCGMVFNGIAIAKVLNLSRFL